MCVFVDVFDYFFPPVDCFLKEKERGNYQLFVDNSFRHLTLPSAEPLIQLPQSLSLSVCIIKAQVVAGRVLLDVHPSDGSLLHIQTNLIMSMSPNGDPVTNPPQNRNCLWAVDVL